MSDQVDAFRAINEWRREERAEKRAERTPAIQALADAGYTVKQITEYQFRINDRLDLYPTRARWHDIKQNKRGGFGQEQPLQFVKRWESQNGNL